MQLTTKVLLVDDSQVARRLLVGQLRELGFTSILEAEHGAQGLQLLLESRTNNAPFGLIITDLRMPSMSGADFLRKINEEPDFKLIPKLIASVETDRGTVLNAVLNGADGYVLKPTTTEVLRLKLEKILSKNKAAA